MKKFGQNVKKIGDKYYPLGRPIIHTEDLYQEKTWSVWRDGDKYFFEFLVARQGASTDKYIITQAEFEGVKKGYITFDDLIRKYDT